VSPDTEKQCFDADMDGYLRKPIERAALVSALEHLLPQALPLRRLRTRSPAGAMAPASPTPPRQAAQPPVDHALMAAQLGTEDMGEHIAALQSFWESCGAGPDELRLAIEANDARLARQIAHSLKGASAMVGAAPLADALKDIEFSARDGNLGRAAGRLAEVQSGFREIQAYLATLTPAA
jgi:HPt (histidine-containing phosphotransfer) domain-containing protein